MIYVVSILIILILLLLDDISPVISVLLFMTILISDKNSPSPFSGASNYYSDPHFFAQVAVLVAIALTAALYRVIGSVVSGRFRFSPLFWGLCALAVVFLMNGLFSEGYQKKNAFYGLLMALCYCGIFTIGNGNIRNSKESLVRVAYGFVAYSMTIIIELLIKYATTKNLFVDGNIVRTLITFGWGNYNGTGFYLVICIPPIVYLAGKEKFGFVFSLYSVLLFACCFMTCSRQAIIASLVTYPVCLIVLLATGKNKIVNAAVLAVTISVGIILLFKLFDGKIIIYFKKLFKQLINDDGELTGNGRTKIWREAIAHFKSAPILGVGFYTQFSYIPPSGLGFVPLTAHNTVLEMMSSCGVIGLVVYLAHRTQTVLSYLKNITVERTYLMISIITFVVISLFDNHMFNIFAIIIYSCINVILDVTEPKMQLSY